MSDNQNPPIDLSILKMQAATDQGTASVVNLAQMAGAYFRELLSQGFEREEAHSLVHEWQDAILAPVRNRPPS